MAVSTGCKSLSAGDYIQYTLIHMCIHTLVTCDMYCACRVDCSPTLLFLAQNPQR